VQFSYLPSLRALLALNRAEPGVALEQPQIAVPHELGVPRSSNSGLFGALYPIYIRGLAYLAAHEAPKPPPNSRRFSTTPEIVINDPIAALAHLQLGRAYALSGDNDQVKIDFLTLRKDADPDIPILKQAKAEYSRLQ